MIDLEIPRRSEEAVKAAELFGDGGVFERRVEDVDRLILARHALAILPLVVTAPRWLPEQEEGKFFCGSVAANAASPGQPLMIARATNYGNTITGGPRSRRGGRSPCASAISTGSTGVTLARPEHRVDDVVRQRERVRNLVDRDRGASPVPGARDVEHRRGLHRVVVGVDEKEHLRVASPALLGVPPHRHAEPEHLRESVRRETGIAIGTRAVRRGAARHVRHVRADVDERALEHRRDVRRLERRRDDDGATHLGTMLARPRRERAADTRAQRRSPSRRARRRCRRRRPRCGHNSGGRERASSLTFLPRSA